MDITDGGDPVDGGIADGDDRYSWGIYMTITGRSTTSATVYDRGYDRGKRGINPLQGSQHVWDSLKAILWVVLAIGMVVLINRKGDCPLGGGSLCFLGNWLDFMLFYSDGFILCSKNPAIKIAIYCQVPMKLGAR